MGPVNWLAVILAANLAVAVRIVWSGPLAGRAGLIAAPPAFGAPRRRVNWLAMIVLLLVSATMLGHMFARLSPGKPWLYFMMAGGVAVTFVAPALWIALGAAAVPPRVRASECGYWIVAFLAMGATFWALS
ncbi:MAG: DUF1761 domain-containing protein [Novosphingobium sp.]